MSPDPDSPQLIARKWKYGAPDWQLFDALVDERLRWLRPFADELDPQVVESHRPERAVDRSGATVLAVRLLGVVLICTSANVVRATIKRRAILGAWFLNVPAAFGVVVALYFLMEK